MFLIILFFFTITFNSNLIRTEPSSVIEIIKFKSQNESLNKISTSQNFKSSDQNGMGQIVNLIFNFLSNQALNSERDDSIEKAQLVQSKNDLSLSSDCTCCDKLNETLTCKSCLTSCSCDCKIKTPLRNDKLDPSKPNFDVSINAYTLILSIGMPCLSIVMIICTLISLTYCCKSRIIGRRNVRSQENSENSNPLANPNISFIYVDFDSTNQSNKKEEPPNYNEIFSSSTQVDKLPTYNSFREKNAKIIDEQGKL
ncbi:unnamed protein product [Brachionus calyciflorus]|uniref:Uncharacterized protein n=1 Tax=Brachionus calyciflorus TaxID=104777 RepID=A0A813WZN3_9BILA|nr:unnamed protein product [Brachionus calyciflorus]